MIGGYTKGVWQPLDGADAGDQDAVALQEVTSRALRDELSLITDVENLVVLAGLGASLGVTNAKGVSKTAPKLSDLWTEVEKPNSFAAVNAHLSPDLVKEQKELLQVQLRRSLRRRVRPVG